MRRIVLKCMAASFTLNLVLLTACAVAAPQQQIWTFDAPHIVWQPAIHDGTAYFAVADKSLHAVDSRSGEEVWRVNIPTAICSNPVVHGDTLYVAGQEGVPFKPETFGPTTLFAFDRATGAAKKSVKTEGKMVRNMDIAGDRLCVVTGPYIHAFDAETAVPLWSYKHRTGMLVGFAGTGSVIAVQGADGRTVGLDASTGKKQWETSLASRSFFLPEAVDGRILTGNMNGEVRALNAADGSLIWTAKTDGGLEGTGVLDGSTLLVTNRNASVYAIDTKNGAITWKSSFEMRGKNSSMFAGVALAGDSLICSVLMQGVNGLSKTTGDKLWNLNTKGPLSRVAAGNDVLLVAPLAPKGMVAYRLR